MVDEIGVWEDLQFMSIIKVFVLIIISKSNLLICRYLSLNSLIFLCITTQVKFSIITNNLFTSKCYQLFIILLLQPFGSTWLYLGYFYHIIWYQLIFWNCLLFLHIFAIFNKNFLIFLCFLEHGKCRLVHLWRLGRASWLDASMTEFDFFYC